MDVKTVRISEKGQVAIPAKMRRRLGLRGGSIVLLIEDEGSILLAKPEEAADALAERLSDLTRFAEQSFQVLWDNRADEIWDRV